MPSKAPSDITLLASNKHPILHLQRTIGNQATSRMLRSVDGTSNNGFPSSPGLIGRSPAATTAPATPTGTPAPRHRKPKHSLHVQIRIADDDHYIVEGKDGRRRFAGLFSSLPKALSQRLIDEVKGRLSFLTDEGFDVSVAFGRFKNSELKIAGNVQVFLVDELRESTDPGEIMKGLYGYTKEAAQQANTDFTDIRDAGPGQEPVEHLGLTPRDQANKHDPETSRPVFVKLPEIFRRDEVNHYREGKKEEAELGVDQIGYTMSHELGHEFRSEPADAPHAVGNFNKSQQTLPPRVMDPKAPFANAYIQDGTTQPRLATERHDVLTAEDLTQLGGMSHVWSAFIVPNLGKDKLIKQATVTVKGELELWYDLTKINYSGDEKTNMTEFLKFIELSQTHHQYGKR